MTDSEIKRFFSSLLQLKKAAPILSLNCHVNFTEQQALHRIHEGFSPNNLPDNLHINRSAVSQMLTNLEQKGLIQRTPNAKDRRKFDAVLTPDGLQILDEIKSHHKAITQEIFSRFDQDKALQLLDLLEEFSQVVTTVTTEVAERRVKPL